MNVDQSRQQGLEKITHWVLIFAAPMAAVGTVSMALIQTAKNTLPLRRWFQRRKIEGWLERYAAGAGSR